MLATKAPEDLSLKLGAFDLVRGNGVQTIADGMTFGEADPVEVVQRTLLQDGDAVRIDRYGNRTITYQVKITGENTAQVAARSARLDAEIGRGSTLTYTPPDGEGPPSVFDVFTSTKSLDFNDWGELKPTLHGRVYTITLRCHPFCRSEIETLVAAIGTGEPAPTPNPQTVDDCTVIGGWSSPDSDTLITATSGAIRAINNPTGGNLSRTVRARRDGVVSLTDTPFVVFDVRQTVGTGANFSAASLNLDNFAWTGTPIAVGPSPDDATYTRLWFQPDVASFSNLMISVLMPGTGIRTLAIDKVVRTNANPRLGSGRQQFRTLTVGGSARAVGSLLLEHESVALGQVLVYTNRDDGSGYQPACRQYRTTGGAESADANTVSGQRSPLNSGTPETYLIPIGRVPAGTYSILARVRSLSGTVNGVTTVTAATRVGTNDLGTRSSGELFTANATGWSIIDAARMTLPSVAAGADAYLKLTVAANVGVEVDEVWIFNTDIGALTRVDCGTATPTPGGSSNRLWIETADLEWPRPAIWLGTEADRTDRRHILAATEQRGRMTHRFPPGTVNLFTVTSNATNVAASLRFYERWMDLAVWPDDMELAA